MNNRIDRTNANRHAQGEVNSAVLFVVGDTKMKDHAKRTNTFGRARTFLMALLMALTMMTTMTVSGATAYAANDTVHVATFDQLQEALEETQGVKKIVVDPQAAVEEGEVVYGVEDDENSDAFYIGFDEPLTVSHDIEITSAEDVDVYFARSDSFRRDQGKPALLNIDSTGNLNLDGLITMTGEEVKTTFYEADEENPAEFIFSVKTKDGTGEDNEAWNRGQALKGGFYIQNNGGEYTLGDDVIMEEINLEDDVEGVEQIHEVEKKTLSLFSSKKSEEEPAEEEAAEEEAVQEEPAQEEEIVVAPAPKKSLKSLRSAPMLTQQANNIPDGATMDADGIWWKDENGKRVAYVANTYQLKKVINDSSCDIVDINSNYPGFEGIVLTEPITVNRKVTIRSTKSGGATIARGKERDIKLENTGYKEGTYTKDDTFSPSASSPALFNVTSNGDLTIGDGVTLSGKEGIADFYPDDPGHEQATLNTGTWSTVAPKDKTMTWSEFNWTDILIGDGANPEKYLALGDNWSVKKGVVETKYLTWLSKNDVFKNDGSIDSRAVWTVRDYNNFTGASAGGVALINKSDTFMLCWNTADGLSQAPRAINYNLSKTINGGIAVYGGWANTREDWTGNRTIDYLHLNTGSDGKNFITGDGPYNSSTDPSSKRKLNVYNFNDAKAAFNKDSNPSDPIPSRPSQAAHFVYTFTDKTWTASEIPGNDYRGYFINAPNGGTVNIGEGVTIGNLTTKCGFSLKNEYSFDIDHDGYSDGSVYNLAPIYVGDGTTLNMTGGTISNNKVGYGANEGDSQSSIQNLKKWINNSQPTNTAGAIIASGENTIVNINGKATLKENRADAGALIIKDGAKVTMDSNDASIDHNVGWHHSGAVLVENGGEFILEDGSINNNVAWLKGGAVWATEFGTIGLVRWQKYPTAMHHSDKVRNSRKGGKFVMNGGELDSNFAFARAGAVEVESNNVYLNGGTISNNMCKSLGGAIYIEGDSPIYSYTLNIRSGYIHDNTAVDSVPDSQLDKRLDNGKLEPATNDYDLKVGWHKDGDWANYGQKHSGDGGGIWLCSMGGTSVFTSTDGNGDPSKKAEVYIAGNHASQQYDTPQNNGWGNDFYISHRHGSALVQNLIGNWYGDDNAPIDTADENGIVMKGPKGMYNGVESYSNVAGIQIIGNRARNGGGIACNGTVILGSASDVYRYEAELEINKEWDGVANKQVTLKLFYDANKNGEIDDDTDFFIEGYEVQLGTGGGVTPTGNELIYQTGRDSAKASIPVAVEHNGQTVELYRIKNQQGETRILGENSSGTQYIDTTNKVHLNNLFTYLNNNGSSNVSLDIEWFIGIYEEGDDYSTSLGAASAKATARVGKEVKLVNTDTGDYISDGSFSVNFNDVTFGQTLTNKPSDTDFELNKKGWNDGKLYGATFKLFETEDSANGNDLVPIGNPTEYTVSEISGNFKLENLKAGKTYLLFETVAPAGYKRPVDPWFVIVDRQGNVTVRAQQSSHRNQHYNGSIIVTSQDGTDHTTSLSGKQWPKAWIDTDTELGNKIVNEVASVKIKKTKSDGSTALKGVRFAFGDVGYSDNNTKYSAGKNSLIKSGGELVVVTSGDDGTIDLTPVIKALDPNANSNKGQGKNINPDEINILMYEISAGELHRLKTVPWLVTITNKGVVKIQEHSNPYSLGETPVNESTKKLKDNLAESVNEFTEVSSGTISGGALVKNEPRTYQVDKKNLNNQPVSGAKFNLYKVDDSVTNVGNDNLPHGTFKISNATPVNGSTPIVSDENGKVALPITGKGSYLLFEVEAPSGYAVSKLPWGIYVNNNNDLSGWKIKESSKATVLSLITDSNGNIKSPITDVQISCDYFEPAAEILNEKISITLTKTNLEGTGIGVAEFDLREADKTVQDVNFNGTSMNNVSLAVKNGGISKTGLKTNNNGQLTITDIDGEKIYLLFEKEAPTGYVKSKAPWMLYVKADGSYRLFKSSSTDTNATSWNTSTYTEVTGSDNAGKLKNNPVNIWFTKGDIADSSVSIKDARFDLYHAKIDGGNYKVDTSKGNEGKVNNAVSFNDSNNKYQVAVNAPAGGQTAYYLLVETHAHAGYILPKTPWLLSVNEYGDYTIYTFTDTAAAAFETAHANETPLDMNNLQISAADITASVANHKLLNEKEQIKITKVRGNWPKNDGSKYIRTDVKVKNAKFAIYDTTVTGTTNNNKKIYSKNGEAIASDLTSDENGQFELPRSITRSSGRKLYWLEETQAAPGYVKNELPWLIEVNNGKLDAIRYADPKLYDESVGFIESNWISAPSTSTYIHNEPLKFKKVTAHNTSQGISGVRFKAYKINNWYELDSAEMTKVMLDEDDWSDSNLIRDVYFGSAIDMDQTAGSDANGEFTFTINDAGAYLIFEQNTPDGYTDNTNRPWLLVIDEEGNYILRRHNGNTDDSNQNRNGPTYWTVKNFDKIDEGAELKLVNERTPIELTKVKASEVNGEPHIDTTNPVKLEGVTFDLYEATKANGKWTRGELITKTPESVLRSDENGKIILPSDISKKAGAADYWLEEKQSAPGYVKSDRPWIIYVEDGVLKHVYWPKSKPTANNEIPSGGQNVVSLGSNVHNYPIRVYKTSTIENTFLPNAKFKVFGLIDDGIDNRPNYRTNSTYYWGDVESKENGVIDLSSVLSEKFGTKDEIRFYIYEHEAPHGYKTMTHPWLIIANRDGTVQVKQYENQASGAPGYPKTTDTSFLAKASFSIDKPNKNLINKPEDLQFTKRDANTDTIIQGAKFQLYDLNTDNNGDYYAGEAFGGELQSNDRGVVNIQNVQPNGTHKFLLFETQATTAYMRETTPWYVVVTDGKITHFVANKNASNYSDLSLTQALEAHWDDAEYEGTGTPVAYNTKVYDLPKTGGMGTYWFMIIGTAMMGFAVTRLLSGKRARKKL